jgi:hypothetical protein
MIGSTRVWVTRGTILGTSQRGFEKSFRVYLMVDVHDACIDMLLLLRSWQVIVRHSAGSGCWCTGLTAPCTADRFAELVRLAWRVSVTVAGARLLNTHGHALVPVQCVLRIAQNHMLVRAH